jgi:hypothetical protein
MTCWREIFLKRNYCDVILGDNCYVIACDRYEEFYQKIKIKRIFNKNRDDKDILKTIGYDK